MTLLSVLQYGLYFLVFSIFVGIGILVVGFCVKEVIYYKHDKPPDDLKGQKKEDRREL